MHEPKSVYTGFQVCIGRTQALPVRPNPSLKLTRYGRRRKAGPRHMVHHRAPALRRLPPRAA